MSDSQESVHDQEQDEVIFTADNQPFKTKQAAAGCMGSKNIDQKVYGICQYPPGKETFAIIKRGSSNWNGAIESEPKETKKAGSAEERFYKVIFQPMAHPNDLTDVMLGVNGEQLVIKREEAVIIPERFKEVADNALTPRFTQDPKQGRKSRGSTRKFPYHFVEMSTKQAYDEQKARGNEMTLNRQKMLAGEL